MPGKAKARVKAEAKAKARVKAGAKAKSLARATVGRIIDPIIVVPAMQPANDALPQSAEALPALCSPSEPYQPHDKLVKCAFANKAIADDFFDAHLDFYKKLSKKVRASFLYSNNEYQKAYQTKGLSDVIYRGEIRGQVCYIDIEHQSRDDDTMPLRTYMYHKSLVDLHIEQGGKGLPITIFICLYHDPTIGKKWRSDTTLNSCFVKDCAKLSFLGEGTKPFKLIDLATIDNDEVIRGHGKAALLEFALRDAHKGSKKYFGYIVDHMRKQGYTGHGTFFMDALIEYIAYICKGNNSLQNIKDVVGELLATMKHDLSKEEKTTMEGTVDRLRQESLQEGRQEGRQAGILEERKNMARGMLAEKVERKTIKKLTHFSDRELDQLSPDESEPSQPLQALQVSSRAERLAHRISSAAEQTASGEMGTASSSRSHDLAEIVSAHTRIRSR